ncbi:phytoene/squalene synthase family protein [Methanosalsum natronophilum]|uniref:Phytoene/squalene synthase family protein n=2 Tax=Methanosalsum natronophilum TaxID=768733 RepID=A0A424Z2Y7_9EURY|nr:MAG: phytoene/squalene synthase family protein [Methanosalsum natronophilum]
MIDKTIHSIFKKGSKTYFYTTIFFPSDIKSDVFTLYSFLRKADDYVDSIPQDINGFNEFKKKYYEGINGAKTGDVVIDSFIELLYRKEFDFTWVDAFLISMEMDLTISSYKTFDELDKYLYGSSEVVGLFMAKILDLPEDAYFSAKYLGRAMQYLNFIRDIDEDLDLGRNYFPESELIKYGLSSLEYGEIKENKENYRSFVRAQIDIYREWQLKAEEGFVFIPCRYLIPIKTASEMYLWTSDQIYKDPLVVYERKIKPSIPRIIFNIAMSLGKCAKILRKKSQINKNPFHG